MTLGEVIVASSVLFVCLTSLAGLLGGSVTSSRMARVRDEAANLANEKIEVARSLPYDRVGLHYANGAYGDPSGDIVTPEQDGSFVVSTECSWVRTSEGRAAYKKLTVHVAWQTPIPGEVAVSTMIYGKSDIVTSGDLVVRLRNRDDGTAVKNATVAVLASDNTARSVLSDDSGEAFFGQEAVGPVGISVTPPAGCIVDTTTMSSAAIPADAVATLIVYVQRPAEATVRVSDTGGDRISGASVSLRRADGAVTAPMLTDSNGEVHFSGLLYSDYTATISKAGYPSATSPLSVSAGAPAAQANVTMSPLAGVGIQAVVYDANVTPISGATVTVHHNGNGTVLQTGISGTNGEIAFAGLSAGAYDVTVEKAGYVSVMQTSNLYDGEHSTMTFHMTPAVYKGNMHVTTKDKNGHLRSIRVIVSGTDYYSDTQWSDGNGSLTLTDLVAGSYQVKCYTNPASTASVIINGGQTAEVSVSQNK